MASPAAVAATSSAALSDLIRDISSTCTADLSPERHRLVRKVSLLSHLLDEIDEFFSQSEAGGGEGSSAPAVDPAEALDQLLAALQAVKRFLCLGRAGLTGRTEDSDNAANVSHFLPPSPPQQWIAQIVN